MTKIVAPGEYEATVLSAGSDHDERHKGARIAARSVIFTDNPTNASDMEVSYSGSIATTSRHALINGMGNLFFSDAVLPEHWQVGAISEADTLARIVTLLESLIRVCDIASQPIAANYVSMARDILRADADLKRELAGV